MLFLKNTNDKTYELRMTKNPITNPQQSPQPTGKRLEDLDPKAATYVNQKSAILNHPNYSESKVYYLEPGINKFENHEHAEYFFVTLGNPEDSGEIPVGREWVKARANENFVLEVDEKGTEIKTNLWKKYRLPVTAQTHKNLQID